jgi:hypothetical protein
MRTSSRSVEVNHQLHRRHARRVLPPEVESFRSVRCRERRGRNAARDDTNVTQPAYLRAFRSSAAKVVTDVVRDDFDGTRLYLLHCERSSGQYLFEVLVDAGVEFGLEIAGCVTFSG